MGELVHAGSRVWNFTRDTAPKSLRPPSSRLVIRCGVSVYPGISYARIQRRRVRNGSLLGANASNPAACPRNIRLGTHYRSSPRVLSGWHAARAPDAMVALRFAG